MYLLQMTVIYTIMPSIVVILANQTTSYVTLVELTFLATFLITATMAWIFYKTVDEFALTNSHRVWGWILTGGNDNFLRMIGTIFGKIGMYVSGLPKLIYGKVKAAPRNFVLLVQGMWNNFEGAIRWRDINFYGKDVENRRQLYSHPSLLSTEWRSGPSIIPIEMFLKNIAVPLHFIMVVAIWYISFMYSSWTWQVCFNLM